MSATNCINDEWLKFCTVNNTLILGTDETARNNGLIDPSNYPSTLFIPRTVQGMNIEAIGQYALCGLTNMKRIIIDARIKTIYHHGISSMLSLEYIQLPNTLERIEYSAIHFWNESRKDHVTNLGIATVVFEPNSKLKFIDDHGISYKETINIISCSILKPQLHSGAFAFVDHVYIFSPYRFSLLKYRSIQNNYSEYCTTCTMKTNKSLFSVRFVFFFILINK